MNELHFGIIGTGYMGKLEARLAQRVPGCSLVGIWNRTADTAAALAQQLGCRHFASVDEMLADDGVNAVVVATPNHAHLDPVVAAARAGKHVFLEKPMSLNVADCRAMMAAAREAGVMLFLGHPQRFMDGIRAAREAVLAGEIGAPVAMRCERIFWVDLHGPSPGWKMKRELSGGHLFHHMHELCTARWLLGDYDSVYAQMANRAHQEDGPEAEDDVVQLAVRFRSGALGTFELGSAYRRREHCLTIHGSEGTIIIHWQGGKLTIAGKSGEVVRPMYDDPEEQRTSDEAYGMMTRGRVHGRPDEDVPLFLRELVADEFRAMVAMANGTFTDTANADLFDDAGLRAVELAQAAVLSNEHRAPVQLPLP
ncbi:MAG: Gfo/Idh/MocA family oxidoreductase [Armatimonadetes bacterium]|nr:Gfo/Idh/MocA family oxidoreductase [Armatimonadota bacterium]